MLENSIYKDRLHTKEQLETAIKDKISQIIKNMLKNVFENMKKGLIYVCKTMDIILSTYCNNTFIFIINITNLFIIRCE